MHYNLRNRRSSMDETSSVSSRDSMASVNQAVSQTSSSSCRQESSWVQVLAKSSWLMYITVLVGAILGGGTIIRIYGNTCGLSLLDPSSWLMAAVTIGSPWCKALNWMGYMATSIVEHLWFHLFGIVVTWFIAFVPGKFQSVPSGTYKDQRVSD